MICLYLAVPILSLEATSFPVPPEKQPHYMMLTLPYLVKVVLACVCFDLSI